jgi:hypothetical protein
MKAREKRCKRTETAGERGGTGRTEIAGDGKSTKRCNAD